jgi:carbon-monoxide dehydrogenase large subunit
MAYPNGAQAAEVEVDPETGEVHLVNYASVDDYGVMVNPMIVEGQVAGAIAQGMGQAVLEGTIFDAKTGQPLTGSFMDYAIPRADNLPSLKLGFSMTQCTTNPFGVKGAGESGAIAAYPAITLAILNALNPLGVNGWDGPAKPETIWRSIQDAKTLNGRT